MNETDKMRNCSLRYVKNEVNDVLCQATNSRKGNHINELHPDINVRLNSVNVIVAKQGFGKTVVALEEIIKLSRIKNDIEKFHLLVYVTKNGDENDNSWQLLKGMIEIPYITVSEENVEGYVKELISAKNLYYKVRRENLIDKIDDGQKQDMLDFLHIDSFDNEFLHTIVLFDDISNSKLFRDGATYFSQLIRRCRHVNMSFFLLIQNWRGLIPSVKNEITTLFIFPSFSVRQIQYIYSQSASNLSSKEFSNMYLELSNYKKQNPESHAYMIVQVANGGETKIIDN